MAVRINWRSDLAKSFDRKILAAQKQLDEMVLSDSNKYVPVDTGTLKNSGIISTKFGSGVVRWRTRYARMQYFLVNRKTTRNINPHGGPFWFERAKKFRYEYWLRMTRIAFLRAK